MIGIIGAMEDEVAALKEAMEIEKTEEQISSQIFLNNHKSIINTRSSFASIRIKYP